MVSAKKFGLLKEDFIKLGYPQQEWPKLYADLIKGIAHNNINMMIKFEKSQIKNRDEWEVEKDAAVQEYKEIARLLRKHRK
jgi:hypothetical protein